MSEMFTRLPEALSASEGTAFITIDGRNRPFADVISLTSNIEKSVVEKKLLGSRVKQHKVVGLSISGSMTLQLINGDMLAATLQYLKTGRYPNISIQVVNDDPASAYGKRDVLLTGVIPVTDLLVMLDGEAEDIITYDTDFTADGIQLLENLK